MKLFQLPGKHRVALEVCLELIVPSRVDDMWQETIARQCYSIARFFQLRTEIATRSLQGVAL